MLEFIDPVHFHIQEVAKISMHKMCVALSQNRKKKKSVPENNCHLKVFTSA